ncbi:hypothetical protein BS78_08G108400 [Paspalum vaginatum]|nr:hypothetical protein BS78_08G108400 [Paspalum vaginatum]
MREEVEIFDSPPTFFELTEVMLRGRLDSGKSRAHYVLMKISCDSDWATYKEIVKSSNVTCFEVVVELQIMSDFVRVKKEAMEAMLKLGEEGGEDSCDAVSYKTFDMCDNFDRVVVSDTIDGSTFNEMEEHDDGDISLESDGEDDESEEEVHEQEEEGNEDEEEQQQGEEVSEKEEEGDEEDEKEKEGDKEDVEKDEEEEEEVSGEEGYGASANFIRSLSEEERMMLEAHNVPLPEVHLYKDLTCAYLAICDMGLGTINETTISTEAIIEEGLQFEMLEKLQDFLRDYSVRLHRPFKVKHSDVGLRYTVVCNQGCPWSVHGRRDTRLGGLVKCIGRTPQNT